MSELLALDAHTILSPFERFSPGRLLIRDGRIEAIGLQADIGIPDGAVRHDLQGCTLAPGFVEPHVHGAGGHDVMEATPTALSAIAQALARHGTTSFLATTVSAPAPELTSVLEQLGVLLGGDFGGARPLGLHLEGPFLNNVMRGTHQTSNIYPPDGSLLERWIQASGDRIRLLTMAPELAGAAALTASAKKFGITMAMGHSDASFAEATEAAAAGVHYAVHTFNAMRPFAHRDTGIIGAVLTDDRIFAEVIADGVHVAPEAVKLLARAKGSTRVILATDATSATGMPDGQYELGGGSVQVMGGVCRDAEGRLAGSTLTQDRALRNFVTWTGMRLDDALCSLTANPADALSVVDRGRLVPGAFADIVALDPDLHVARTYVSGALVFVRRS